MADTEQNSVSRLDDENRRLRAAVAELSILNDIATTISSAYTLEQLIDLIVKKCIKHLRVEQGAVMLLDSKDASSEFKTMVRKANSSHEVLPFRLDAQLAGWMITHKEPLLINELGNDERFKLGKRDEIPYRSLLSVPLCLKGRIIGSINVFNKRSEEGFTDADKRLLTIIATQSAQVIENARLSEEEMALRRRGKEHSGQDGRRRLFRFPGNGAALPVHLSGGRLGQGNAGSAPDVESPGNPARTGPAGLHPR
jgi:GAF domain-containing protein